MFFFIPQLFLIVLLVFFNGFFVAAEFALVSVRKTRIDELVRKGNKDAKLVQKALSDMESYISATQLGITLVSLGLGWLGEPVIAKVVDPLFSHLPAPIAVLSSHTLAIGVAFVLITFVDIVLGELAPKSLAINQSEKITFMIIKPLSFLALIFKPFTFILNGAGSAVLRSFNIAPATGKSLAHTEEEIKLILSDSAQHGVIENKEAEMVDRVFRLGHMPVKKIMIPKGKVIAFEASSRVNEIFKDMADTIHTRYPVFSGSIENIIGFVHIKDIHTQHAEKEKTKRLFETNLIRQAIQVHETRRIDSVLFEMQKKQKHLAIITDHTEKTVGIITIEDILESLLGQMQDEFKDPLYNIEKISDGKYRLGGLLGIGHLQHRFKLFMDEKEYDTVEGIMYEHMNNHPKLGKRLRIGKFILAIESMRGRRILEVLLQENTKAS